MTDYGVIPEGFRRKTVDDIVGEMEADQLATMYEDMDVSAESILGQQNGIVGNQLGTAWEQLEVLYNAGDVDAAEDRLLENLCKLLGVYRIGDTKGLVALNCGLVAGTTLTPSEQFAAMQDQPDIRWTPAAPYTATTTGIQEVAFEAEIAGPIFAAAGSITVIATPVVGWTSVSQPHDADPGERIQDDLTLRTRRKRELALKGSATLPAIEAKVSQRLGEIGVVPTLIVYENDTDFVDADGRPPHTIEVLVFDGDAPPLTNNDVIAQAIVDSGIGGIETYGNTSGTAQIVDGNQTVAKTVAFTRVIKKPVYLTYEITPGPNYPGDATLKAQIVTDANADHLPGYDVSWSFLMAEAFVLKGVRSSDVYVGFDPVPMGSDNLPIGLREIARFDTSRITILHPE